MQNVEETQLAWALLDAAKPYLPPRQRNVFVLVGAGDTFGGICELFTLLVRRRIPVGEELVGRCSAWLNSYAYHEDEPYLRRLVSGFSTGTGMHAQAVRYR